MIFGPSDIRPAKLDNRQTTTRNNSPRSSKRAATLPGQPKVTNYHPTTNIHDLLRRTRTGLRHARQAATCLASENRDRQFNINKVKWCTTICKETLNFSCGLLSEGQDLSRRIQQPQIDEDHQGFVGLFRSLFFQLASLVQKPNRPELSDVLGDLVKAYMVISGQQGGRQEKMWLDGLAQLQKLLEALEPDLAFECLQESLLDGDAEKLARYHVYSMLFRMVLRQYEDEWIRREGVRHWELVLSRLRSLSGMTSDFMALIQFSSSTPDVSTSPSTLVQRLSSATRFAEGHYLLSQAYEAEADIFDQPTYTEKESLFNRAYNLYSKAHEELKEIDKAKAGMALAKIGILWWKLFPAERCVAIDFLTRALTFETDAEPDSQWLLQTKSYIEKYKEEQRVKEEERLRKEREEKMRQEREAQKLREMADRERENKWSENLGILRSKMEEVETPDQLVGFIEWIQTNYEPPEMSARTQLRQRIGELQCGGPAKLGLKKIILLYHPDKNGTQGAAWENISAEITKVLNLVYEKIGTLSL